MYPVYSRFLRRAANEHDPANPTNLMNPMFDEQLIALSAGLDACLVCASGHSDGRKELLKLLLQMV